MKNLLVSIPAVRLMLAMAPITGAEEETGHHSPDWADDAAVITHRTCEAIGVDYVRGDEVDAPKVIRSI